MKETQGVDTIRSFIAIELPPNVLQALGKVQESLRPYSSSGVKWVDSKGVHLTLKFLGGVAPDRLERVSAALSRVAKGVKPITLQVKGLGVFPDPRRPRVVWVGLEGDIDSLAQLQRDIDSALAPLGFGREDRPFVPHLTLARLREEMRPQDRQDFGQKFLKAELAPLAPFTVEFLNLMKSQLTPRGAIYSVLGTYKFFA